MLIQKKPFKGTVVNQALSSLHGGSLEITLTVVSYLYKTLITFTTMKNIEDI